MHTFSVIEVRYVTWFATATKGEHANDKVDESARFAVGRFNTQALMISVPVA
jgi:hypothetical protein